MVLSTPSTTNNNTIKIGSGDIVAGNIGIGSGPTLGYDLELGYYTGGSYVTKASISTGDTGWAYTSDRRDKTDISDILDSDFILSLNPVRYNLNLRDLYYTNGVFDEHSYAERRNMSYDKSAGLISQDVYRVLLDIYGEDFGILLDSKDKLNLSYEAILPFLVMTIQKQNKRIDILYNKLLHIREEYYNG